MSPLKFFSWVWCGWGALTGGAWAAGYYLPNQDAFATARGNAFVATADSAASVHYNPAGLTQLDRPELEAGVYAIELGTEVNTPSGRFHAEREWQGVPALFYGMPLGDRAACGFGLSSPYGLGSEWGQRTPFRTVTSEAHLMYVSATGAFAYELAPGLSAGLTLAANEARLELARGLGFFPGDYLSFEGDGFAVSAGLGLRWQPTERHAFGLTYTCGTSTDLDGKVHSNLLPDGTGELDFSTPDRVAFGYSFRPARGWNMELNVEWLDWDSLNTWTLRSASVPGGSVVVPFHWDSTFIYEAGVSYTTESGWKYALGYDYNQSAQPDATYNPSVGDADIQYVNAGFGRDCGDWGWFVTFQLGFANHVVSGSQVTPAGESADGKYETFHKAVALSVQRRF